MSSPSSAQAVSSLATPTPKMTSSAPAGGRYGTFDPVSLPAPMPQPPIPSWQTRCIQQPVPLAQLEEFLAQDVEQNSPPEEQSTLVHAVARDMDPVQQAAHAHAWRSQEVDKRRKMMAQPAWRSTLERQQAMEHQQGLLAKQPAFQPPPTTFVGMTSLTSIQGNQASSSASSARQQDPSSSSSESATWDAWCELQESASNYHISSLKPAQFCEPSIWQ